MRCHRLEAVRCWVLPIRRYRKMLKGTARAVKLMHHCGNARQFAV